MAMPSNSEIRSLTPEERIRLIEMLWESFVESPESLPVTDRQLTELQQRLAEHDANPEAARPWSEVRSELDQE